MSSGRVLLDLPSLLQDVEKSKPDVVITDIRMPPTNTDEGIRAASELRETQPEIGVVVISHYVSPHYALRLFEHGSAGRAYLLKEHIGHRIRLMEAIREVAEGGSVVDPTVVDVLVEARCVPELAAAQLTARSVRCWRTSPAAIERGDRERALPDEARDREEHQLDLLEARARGRRRGERRVAATLLYLAEARPPTRTRRHRPLTRDS
jgi:CheY-like chemotaxis protein